MIHNSVFLQKAEALMPELLVTSQELLGKDRVLKAEDEPILLPHQELYPDLFPAKIFLRVRRSP